MTYSQKGKYCVILLIWSTYNSQIYKDRKYNCGCKGWGKGEIGTCLMGREFCVLWDKKSSGDWLYNNVNILKNG